MDIFRHYFSEFISDTDELSDKTFAIKTNEFSYEMYMTIQEVLLSEFPGTNIIITGTLRETDWVEETFRKYKANSYTNYKIKLVSLAVPKKESAISVIERYVMIVDTQKNNFVDFIPGTARYTSRSYHDETFDNFPKNLRYFESINYTIDEDGNKTLSSEGKKLIDVFEVYRRSKVVGDYNEDTLVYSSERPEDNDKTSSMVVDELRKAEPRINHKNNVNVLKKIAKNMDYFKEQGTLNEIVFDLGNLLGYNKDIEKKNMYSEDYGEPKI